MACLSKNDTGFLEVSSLNFLYEIIVLIKTTADFQLILTSLYNSRSLSRHARGRSRDPRLCETYNSLVRPIHSLASRNAFLYSTINISTKAMWEIRSRERDEELSVISIEMMFDWCAGARVELDVSRENKKDGKRARIELVTVRPRWCEEEGDRDDIEGAKLSSGRFVRRGREWEWKRCEMKLCGRYEDYK